MHSRRSGLLAASDTERLREALASAGYTSKGIADRIGPAAAAAAARNDLRATLRNTADAPGDRLATLIRLFVCGQSEPAAAVAHALAPLTIDAAIAAGLVEPAPAPDAPPSAPRTTTGALTNGDRLRAAVELETYGDWWIVSDLSAGMRPGVPLAPEHVLGVGGASSTLAAATIRRPVSSALDLGTGCGVQALHLSTHAERVTATDLSERALRFAATTAALNGLDWELLRGDMTAPVAGRRFDLIVSNPPFVAGPGTRTHTYRDSGRAGDAVCSELVAAVADLLAEGGTAQFLANWLHVEGEDWRERVARWLEGTGLDAWVIQREVSDPVGYVSLWLDDASEAPATRPARAAAWLDWFDANRIEGVGFGLVTLRAGGHDDPTVRIEELRQPLGDQASDPLGGHVAAWFARQDWLRGHPSQAILDTRLYAPEELRLRQEAVRGEEGWQVERQVLSLAGGLRWSEEIDPVALALVGGCDGRVALRDQVALLAAAHDVDVDTLAEVAAPLAAHLVERGMLVPADLPAPADSPTPAAIPPQAGSPTSAIASSQADSPVPADSPASFEQQQGEG